MVICRFTFFVNLNFLRACKIEPKFYKYYDSNTYGLNFDGMIQHLDQIPDRSVVLLHACAHNPTGVDPTPNQWHELATLFKSKNHFPVFDMAYQVSQHSKIAKSESLNLCISLHLHHRDLLLETVMKMPILFVILSTKAFLLL